MEREENLVERLRGMASHLYKEAAAEIERLRAERDAARDAYLAALAAIDAYTAAADAAKAAKAALEAAEMEVRGE